MSAAAPQIQVVRAIPGRLRVHLPRWPEAGRIAVESRLRAVPGVREARASALTRNVVVEFDAGRTTQAAIMDVLGEVATLPAAPAGPPAPAASPPAVREMHGEMRRVRIPVRGIDRDGRLARRVLEQLEALPGVRQVVVSQVTGRVLVEFSEREIDLQDILADVVDLELPPLTGEDRPEHPLDAAPLYQGGARLAGAGLGLGLLAVRRLSGASGALAGGSVPGQIAGIIGLLRAFPAVRSLLERLLGRNGSDLVLGGASVVSLALANSPLGLALNAIEALRLVTEVAARRQGWRHYEQRVADAPAAHPGTTVRVEPGEAAPLAAEVLRGTGTAIGRDGLPVAAAQGLTIGSGARVCGGTLTADLQMAPPFTPELRPPRPSPPIYRAYLTAIGPLSLAYTGTVGVVTRSPGQALDAMLQVNPRAAVIGRQAADLSASARVIRSGVTVVGTRPHRPVRRPDVLILDGARVLTDGLELSTVLPLSDQYPGGEVQELAAEVALAAGMPWGTAFPPARAQPEAAGSFDGRTASAGIGGVDYTLGPPAPAEAFPVLAACEARGEYPLVLRAGAAGAIGIVALRPRLATGAAELVALCRSQHLDVVLAAHGRRAGAESVARRAGLDLTALDARDVLTLLRERQQAGALVAVVSDAADAAQAFEECDLAVVLVAGRGHFAARPDLIVPDLQGLAAVLDAGVRRDAAVRDATVLSAVANVAGVIWGLRGDRGAVAASRLMNVAGLGALALGWLRLRGGKPPRSSISHLADPHPERWGWRPVPEVLRSLGTRPEGLASQEAAARRRTGVPSSQGRPLLRAIAQQLQSPLIGMLTAGAVVTLLFGAGLDLVIIGATIAANVAIGAWQERQADTAVETLRQLGVPAARVLRDGAPVTVPATDIVDGDLLLLAPGDRVAADARLLEAESLEVDEAALTGESLPVRKSASGTPAQRMVLEGSDLVSGTGRAVVVATGPRTRLGATAAALAENGEEESPLDARLSRILRQALPLAAGAGALVAGAGLLWRQPLLRQLPVATSMVIAAVPEGLPLLSKVGEVAVARRLAARSALVRHLSAVEALGRVDVACADKTGTITQGRLVLQLVADWDGEAAASHELPASLQHVLQIGALASPHPDSVAAGAHPTDVAVAEGAARAGLADVLRVEREEEYPFDPARAFHVTVVNGLLAVKGAPEALLPRCDAVRTAQGDLPLGDERRAALRARAEELAGRGLRVLLVAERPSGPSLADPRGLVALGFLGIADPLRPNVPAAVQRCREAGVRVIMLTGDHPATARAIAREAGLLRDGDDGVLTGLELATLMDDELDRRLARTTVIARATPLDKLRIIESLRRQGHTVAMTGDGVNDAPALRLADVGIAMGRGTEVARQAADVVLAADDFGTLVETLVEGRTFWRNVRRALGLLLGGNLGEVGLVTAATMLGAGTPLTTRQILAVNVVTDVLPALAVTLQRPEQRNLAGLDREGTAALAGPLRDDVARRAVATAVPSLAAYLVTRAAGGLPRARAVAFGSIVATQLAQTLDVGWSNGRPPGMVLGAVAGSAGLLVAALTVPALQTLLGLTGPGLLGWGILAGGSLAAVVIGRAMARLVRSPAPAPAVAP